MKHRFISRLLCAVALSGSVCGCELISEMETKFLTVETIGKSTIASFFSEISGLEAAGQGLHHEMETFIDGTYLKYADITGDMLNVISANVGEGDLYLFNFEMKTEYVATYPRTLWNAGWSVVTAANNILYYGPQLLEGATESEKARVNKILGWGYFARGMAHWCLCNCYAQPYCYTPDASHLGVPVVTHVPGYDEEIPRESVAKVYQQAISDVQHALAILGDEASVADPYRIGGIACEALLARIYLYKQDWANAELYSSRVMAKVPLTKREDYVAMYRTPFDEPGEECILRMNQYSGSSSLVSTYDPTRSSGADFEPSPALASKYSADDIRAELLTYIPESCEDAAYQGRTYNAVCKYCPLKSLNDDYRVPNPFFLRCSEMYLIHAEAISNGSAADLAGAIDDLKALEARARGVEKISVSLPYSDLASVNALIQEERRKELCFEGHSLFDFIRRGEGLERPDECNSKIKRLPFGDHRLILPIDETEMEANDSMVQNEGYE